MTALQATLEEWFSLLFEGREGLVCLAKLERTADGEEIPTSWQQEYFQWPRELPKMEAFAAQWRERGDVFYAPTLYSAPSRRAQDYTALPGRALWMDMDHALVDLDPEPTLVVQTSAGHYQPIWIVNQLLEPEVVRRYNYALKEKYHGDHKWTVDSLLRLPGTLNTKSEYGGRSNAWLVQVCHRGERVAIESLSWVAGMPEPGSNRGYDADFLETIEDDLDIPAGRRRYDKRKLNARSKGMLASLQQVAADEAHTYGARDEGRSGWFYKAVGQLIEMGLPLAGVVEEATKFEPGIEKYGELGVYSHTLHLLKTLAWQHAGHVGTYKWCVDAKCRPIPDWQMRRDEPQVPSGTRSVPFIKASLVEERPLTLLGDTYPVGELTILSGSADLGKSSYVVTDIARMTSSRPLLNGSRLREPIKAVIVSIEDRAHRNRARLRLWGADLDLVYLYTEDLDEDGLAITDPDHVDMLEEFVMDQGIRLIFVDPIADWLGSSVDNYNNAKYRAALKPLRRLLDKHQLVGVGLEHFNKNTQETNPRHRVSGSHGLVDLARNGFVFLDQTKPEDDRRVSIRTHFKHNLFTRPLPTQVFTLREHPSDPRYPEVVHLGTSAVTAEDVLREQAEPQRRGPQPTKREEAKAFLRGFLAEGPQLVEVVKAEAEVLGISTSVGSTLHEAKKELGVQHGRFNGPQGPVSWYLPNDRSIGSPR